MRTIDNNGNGNCGYYAYSISLMYFLRTQSDQTIATVLGRFSLSANALSDLKLLCNHKDITKPFSNPQLQLIQNTLGPACRALASRSVKEEFIEHPDRSSLYSAAAYHFFVEYRKGLAKKYQEFVEVPDEKLGNFSEAELYKTPRMKAAMTAHAKATFEHIQNEFDTQWKKLIPTIAVTKHAQAKIMLMDTLIQQQAIQFFQKKDRHFLNVYVNHLAQDTIWASEETLLSLHEKVTNNRPIYNRDFDKWVDTCETPISLAFLSNGTNRSGTAIPTKDYNMLINNRGNCHWVSVIPNTCCAGSQRDPSKQSDSSCCLFSEKPVAKRISTSSATLNTPEAKLEDALKCIKNKQDQEKYKPVLLCLFKKGNTIDNIDTAEALEDESDEAFAERLQIAELNAFLR